jgi:hypothetical protein
MHRLSRKSQKIDGINWRFSVSNFTHVAQYLRKTRAGIHLSSQVKYDWQQIILRELTIKSYTKFKENLTNDSVANTSLRMARRTNRRRDVHV